MSSNTRGPGVTSENQKKIYVSHGGAESRRRSPLQPAWKSRPLFRTNEFTHGRLPVRMALKMCIHLCFHHGVNLVDDESASCGREEEKKKKLRRMCDMKNSHLLCRCSSPCGENRSERRSRALGVDAQYLSCDPPGRARGGPALGVDTQRWSGAGPLELRQHIRGGSGLNDQTPFQRESVFFSY